MYEIQCLPISADKKSQMNHLHMSAKSQRTSGVLWNRRTSARSSARRWPKDENADGAWSPHQPQGPASTIRERANRALSGHTLKTLASGAVAR